MKSKLNLSLMLWLVSLTFVGSGCRLPVLGGSEIEAVPTTNNLQPTLTLIPPTALNEPSLTPSATPITPVVLATPYAQEPAAGICGAVEGDLAMVDIFPDIPSPRCLKVSRNHRLLVTNQTGQEITIRIGTHDLVLPAGEKAVIDDPLGSYLAVGVHLLDAAPFGGPELWLVE